MEPTEKAEYWQADQIAECLDVSRDTYAELWNVIVPLYDKEPRGEYPGEYSYAITNYWNKLSEVAQRDINQTLEALD